MMKRIIAILLCLITISAAFVGCSTYDENEPKGQQLTMYLTENLYDLDPARAYYNESTINVISLMFETLFKIDNNGNLEKSLVKSYSIKEDDNTGEYVMTLKLNGSCWSNGSTVDGDDVVYAWKRILRPDTSYEAASLLYDIKNARALKEGDRSVDDLGIYADGLLVSITFEQPIDYNHFLTNLTSLALAPLDETSVDKGDDWAKKATSMLCSGPFKLSKTNVVPSGSGRTYTYSGFWDSIKKPDSKDPNKLVDTGTVKYNTDPVTAAEYTLTSFVLERNIYYYRDTKKDSIKKYVTPYKIVVDCSLTDEELQYEYDNGLILYMGDIPVSLRETYKDQATIEDAMSTNICYLNENADVYNKATNDTEHLFADAKVRQALSLVIDRDAIVNKVVFGKVATGLIPEGVYTTTLGTDSFRSTCSNTYEYLTKDIDKAKSLLKEAGVKPSDYVFSLTYAAYDDVHEVIAKAVCEAWTELGFNVSLKARGAVVNKDFNVYILDTPSDICDDIYERDLFSGDFETIILDMNALSMDPFSVLAPYAKAFSGQGLDMTDTDNYKLTPHITNYNSDEYNKLIEDTFSEKDIDKRAENYYKAEKMLMNDMPVIPIIFNQTATLESDMISNVKSESMYLSSFTKAKISEKNYKSLIYDMRDYLADNFETWKVRTSSSLYSNYHTKTWEDFTDNSSIYSFIFDYISAEESTDLVP